MSLSQSVGKKPIWKSKWAIAAHIALVYAGVSFYVQSLVKQEQRKRGIIDTGEGNTASNAENEKRVEISHNITTIENTKQLNNVENIRGASFNDLADKYDGCVKFDEMIMGLNFFRKRLLSHAKGDVLEIACGTGRNIPFYPANDSNLKSVTFVDTSRNMLERTVDKYLENKDRFQYTDGGFLSSIKWWWNTDKTEEKKEIPSQFFRMDARSLAFSNDSFDTVIDTFGLCSIGTETGGEDCGEKEAVEVLNEMARVCKPDGKVLLLEHGQGTYSFINGALEKHRVKHYEKWGCWWDRDILRLIEQSELEIEYQSRWHFGTTCYLVCRPRKLLQV